MHFMLGWPSWLGTADEFIGGIFNIIWAVLCVPVYMLIRTMYNLFIKIAELDILSNADMNEIYKRVTMIITIVMAFYVIFNIIKYTISPDTVTDKEKGAYNIVYRMIVVILLIAFVPEIFSMAYKIQNRIISSQVIPKVIMGHEAWDYSTYGSSFAADTFSAFYRVDRDHCEDKCDEAEQHVSLIIEDIRQGGSVVPILGAIWGQVGISDKGTVPAKAVEFDGLLALLFGGFAVYVLFLYCIDVAVRYVQLLYLQIISPIAIVGYISPGKDNIFEKWWKQCLTTYIDLFIRISIMYFALLIIKILGHGLKITSITSGGQHIGPFVYIFFVMGVLIFVQRAPKLIGDLLPGSGAAGIGFGFSWKTRGEPLKQSIDAIKKPIAATAGAAMSGISAFQALKSGDLKSALGALGGNKMGASDIFQAFKSGKSSGGFRGGLSSALNAFGKTKMGAGLSDAYTVGRSAFSGGRDAGKSGSVFGAYVNRDKYTKDAETIIEQGGTPLGHDLGGARYEVKKTIFKEAIDSLSEVVKTKKTLHEASEELKTNKATQALIADWKVKGLGDPTVRDKVGKDIEKAMRIFAVSTQDSKAQADATSAITAAIQNSGIYAKGSADETAAIASVLAQFTKDKGSVELTILQKQIEQATKTIQTSKSMDSTREKAEPTTLQISYEDKNGKKHSIPFKGITKEQVAEFIGDIEKAASEEIVETEYSDEYKAAQANANAPGKKE